MPASRSGASGRGASSARKTTTREQADLPLSAVRDLGDLQLAILEVLWEKQGGTVYEVQAALERTPKPAYTTVLTVLRNLERRSLVTHEAVGGTRMYRYRAATSFDVIKRLLIRELASRLFGGSMPEMVLYLVDSGCLTRSDLQTIRKRLGAAAEDHEPASQLSLDSMF
jgi:predicted transcriptional regulator